MGRTCRAGLHLLQERKDLEVELAAGSTSPTPETPPSAPHFAAFGAVAGVTMRAHG